MQTLIDAYELRAFYDLPAPVIETYRPNLVTPRMSIDLEIEIADFEDEGEETMVSDPTPSSERFLRARTWSSED